MMAEHKPRLRTQVAVGASFFALVLPAICFAGMGYFWFIEHVLKLDTNAKPEGIADRLLILLTMLPMIPTMLVGILVAGIPWMFAMARLLPLADIEYYSKQKGPRLPLLSGWLDRLWESMTASRRCENPADGSRR